MRTAALALVLWVLTPRRRGPGAGTAAGARRTRGAKPGRARRRAARRRHDERADGAPDPADLGRRFYITSRPRTDEAWGTLQAQTLMLAESGTLLMQPSRARGRSQWLADARLMLEAGRKAFAAAKAKDVPDSRR